MTQTDIALLLADAADEVEIGIAPVQAVMRGGRRRRARRWAVAATTALVLAGSTGATLALTGMPGGHGGRGAPVATRPASPEARHVFEPQRTDLATGTDHGKKWQVFLDVWGAPRDESEAERQIQEMGEYGVFPGAVEKASALVGKTSYFVRRAVGDGEPSTIIFDSVTRPDEMSGHDLKAGAAPLLPGTDGPTRLVVGQVAKTAERVTCTWKDGTTTDVAKPPANTEVSTEQPAIRAAEGFPANWFVCLAPASTSFKSVEVTK
ncbi:hypothetical protein ACWGI9_38175 [Streptomyces sp. NPDC054833]